MLDFMLATYHVLPDLDPDDHLLVEALKQRGKSVGWGIWNEPSVDWRQAHTVVVRSTWDYHRHYAAFVAWAERVASHARLVNPLPLVKWGASKTYLLDLERAGVPVVPTVVVAQPRPLATVAGERGWRNLIVKPAVGLATAGVKHVQLDDAGQSAAGDTHLQDLLMMGAALVQPYLPGVADNGERALVFVDGKYSHAVSKSAFQQMAVAGRAGERGVTARPDQIALGERALAACPQPPTYARVDMVDTDTGPVVLELELVEPSLFLTYGPHAAGQLADALSR